MVRIEVELIDAEDVIKMDEDGNTFKDLIPNVVHECVTSETYLAELRPEIGQSSPWCCVARGKMRFEAQSSNRLTEKLKTGINRSLRVSDKYLRLLSLLVKSREFHMAYPCSGNEGYLPVIELPKTREGKPFIPTTGGSPSPEHEFNISHQHPYLGIARAKGIKRVGMDIVTFDDLNTRLYQNERQFVDVFQSHFAESEWNSIVTASSIVHEFYLQWAIKEAYTKASGLGMSLNFNSFITELDGVDNLWEYVLANANPEKGTILPGSVHRIDSQAPAERWNFLFVLLRSNNKLRGCVCTCICAGNESIDDPVTVDVSWMEVAGLLSWHEKTSS